MAHHEGNFSKVCQHVRVRRLVLSEQDRIGIGTFQPKDEKNQDATELTGDVNYRKIAEFGTDSFDKDVALITDGRFSGGTRGAAIGHVSPEAQEGGAIAIVEEGDRIRIDIPNKSLDLLVFP